MTYSQNSHSASATYTAIPKEMRLNHLCDQVNFRRDKYRKKHNERNGKYLDDAVERFAKALKE